jgi:hypothetical protein
VTVGPLDHKVKPNSKKRMNLRASAHPRSARTVGTRQAQKALWRRRMRIAGRLPTTFLFARYRCLAAWNCEAYHWSLRVLIRSLFVTGGPSVTLVAWFALLGRARPEGWARPETQAAGPSAGRGTSAGAVVALVRLCGQTSFKPRPVRRERGSF